MYHTVLKTRQLWWGAMRGTEDVGRLRELRTVWEAARELMPDRRTIQPWTWMEVVYSGRVDCPGSAAYARQRKAWMVEVQEPA